MKRRLILLKPDRKGWLVRMRHPDFVQCTNCKKYYKNIREAKKIHGNIHTWGGYVHLWFEK
jgi:hypothetical protein